MDNLNHGAGRGSPMVNLYNGKELDQNLCIAEMAGGPEDTHSANARESYSHKDAQNNPVSSRPSRGPKGHLGTEVPARVGSDGCSGGGQVGDTSRGDLSEDKLFVLVAFLEEEMLGLVEHALESMKKYRSPPSPIPIPGPRKKMKTLRRELMNTPREVRRRTLIACTAVWRI